MFNKVLVLSASAGAGHIRAAQALEKAFIEMGATKEIKHIDTLEYTNKLFRNLYSKAYIDLVNAAPELLGWLYDHLDKPWKNERRRLAIDKLNTRPFVKMLQDYQPDFVISTHFLPAEIISWLKAKERLQTSQAIVVTDIDIHAMWLCHHYEHYFVAIEETKMHMQKLGIPEDKISVTGIPIDPVFAKVEDKFQARQQLGLRQDITTILISAGGFGVGPIEHLISSLLQLQRETQIVAICGKSQELKQKIDQIAKQLPSEHKVVLKVVGFTKEMDRYMSASDILVGKPGGLTTSEALAKGLVLVIVNPIPGQEERNSDHYLEEGVAIRCNNLPTLAYKIDKLLDDATRFNTMKENVRKFARPKAAYDIVSKLLELKK
ncbi:MAG: glycosyltransferase [Blastocatellia bacterium]|nr:glycosyltransferase [Blastocatellia bacterium]